MPPTLRVTATGNAGFCMECGGFACAVDALWAVSPRYVGGGSPVRLPKLDLVLITHSHWDHFDPRAVLRASGPDTAVLGPPEVVRRLPDTGAKAIWPRSHDERQCPEIHVGPFVVTAYRTTHGNQHLSFLVEFLGFRLFHDGDNEDTRTLPVRVLHPIDVLMLCPWQGSGWVDFVESLSPKCWALSHLSSTELGDHAVGRFLPELCDRVPLPERIVGLGPGEAVILEGCLPTCTPGQPGGAAGPAEAGFDRR